MKSIFVAAFVALLAAPASATVITFEDLSDGDVVTDQFDGVEFSSVGGQQNEVTTQPGLGFGDNFICTAAVGSSINCTSETILTFDSGVSDLSFYQIGDNATGVVALVDIYIDGILDSTVDILGFDTPSTPDLVDLTGFTNITSIRIHSITDPAGLGWDNFSFELAAVPLPAGGLLLLTALGGLVIGRRRKTS